MRGIRTGKLPLTDADARRSAVRMQEPAYREGRRERHGRGVFSANGWIPIGHTDVVQRRFSYPVAVTLSRIRICGDSRHHYTRIETRFLSAVPREVRRQAKPPGTASCLRARPGG
jgi:hypothetical protein